MIAVLFGGWTVLQEVVFFVGFFMIVIGLVGALLRNVSIEKPKRNELGKPCGSVPTEEGWYWYIEDNPHLLTNQWRVLEVQEIPIYRGPSHLGVRLCEHGEAKEYYLEELNGQWGPKIEPPIRENGG